MPSTANQPLSESTLLTRYLLTPSSLPTILPYNTFLNLLPTATRNDPDLQSHLRRLYADLQFQRNLDIDTVRANIARECARAGTVKATLRQALARELGDEGASDADAEVEYVDMLNTGAAKRDESVELVPSRKRKRARAGEDEDEADRERTGDTPSSSESDVEGEADRPGEEGPVIPESPSSSSPPPSEPPPPTAPTALSPGHLDAALDTAFHGQRGLALPSSYAAAPAQRVYHSRASLLGAMEAAIADLQGEIARLETEAAGVMEGMRETVSGLSDLRYGKLARDGSGGVGLETDVEEGLRALREVAERKLRDS